MSAPTQGLRFPGSNPRALKSDDQRTKTGCAKQKFLDAQKEIELLRQAIAYVTCPLKIGDIISVVKDGKDYEGRIDRINAIASPEEMFGPIVGKPSGWAAGGPRRNKTGEFGKWTFGINSFDASFENGKWVVKPSLTLEQQLGLS